VKIAKLFGATFALLSIILGALNSHNFKKLLPETASESIDISLRYMMFHGLALLILSVLSVEGKKLISFFLITGTLLFSFSISVLSFQSQIGFNLSWLGPITPIGGCLLIFGWILILFQFIKN
tara:strand:+ start:103 stop:471 length:369 start_codon:yes stop_codon:yes gene_type:complete